MEAFADILASSISFCSDRFYVDSEASSFPFKLPETTVKMASYLEGIDVKHRLWFRSELARLVRTIGDGTLEGA